MNLRKISFITSVVISLTFLAAYAQDAPQNTANREPIENAAKKLYRGIANSDMATIFENTSQKYLNRKLTPNKLRLPETGPKVTVSWDDEVTIVHSDDKTAVVEAGFFKPEGSDVPEQEVSRLRLFLINEHGAWVASAPKKKQAQLDANDGGWYHSALFTFCPNTGIQFLPNHFSTETNCKAVAICR